MTLGNQALLNRNIKMSHEVETMAFAGKTPWHGLGQHITDPNDLVDGSAFMMAAGLDWNINKVSIRLSEELPTNDGFYLNNVKADFTNKIVENQFYLVRSSDGNILSTRPVTDGGYNLRQNAQMFELFDPLIAEGKMQFHTAGSLFGGRKVWVLAEMLTGFTLPGDDQINNFFLFTMDHSGVGANTAFYTSVRVVCANTCRYAERGAKNKIRDTHKVRFDLELMREAIKLVETQSVDFEQLARAMAAKRISGDERVNFFRDAFNAYPKTKKEGGRLLDSTIVQRAVGLTMGQRTINKATHDERASAQDHIDQMQRGVLIDSMNEDIGGEQSELVNPGWNKVSSDNTLWGAFNAVTFIEDHDHRKKGSADGMLHSTLYGQTLNDPKTRALNAARELLAV